MIGHKEVSRELNSDVGQPRKGNKDKKRYFICCDIIPKIKDNLEIKDKEILEIKDTKNIILKIKDKEIYYSRDKR